MANFLKRSLLSVFSLIFPGLGNRGAILMYHSVDRNNLFFTVQPQEFERQMQYLKQKKYSVIPLSEMCLRLKEGKSIKRCVAITFDDGYTDFFKNAYPVLKRYNFPATMFLASGLLGKAITPTGSKAGLPIMSEGDVKRAAAANDLVEFMPHTKTHADLDKLTIENALEEINESRRDIEALTGKPADVLAYPRGRYTSNIVTELKKSSEWLGAVTVEAGLVKPLDDLFLLKRLSVDSATTLPIFKQKLSRGIEAYERAKNRR